MDSNIARVFGIPVIESDSLLDENGNPTWTLWPPMEIIHLIPQNKREKKLFIHPECLKILIKQIEERS